MGVGRLVSSRRTSHECGGIGPAPCGTACGQAVVNGIVLRVASSRVSLMGRRHSQQVGRATPQRPDNGEWHIFPCMLNKGEAIRRQFLDTSH